jgi:hypothetical protein
MSSEAIGAEERHFIERAAHYLENPSFLIRVANMIGHPLEKFAQVVPTQVHQAVETALRKVMELAIVTVPRTADPNEEFALTSTSSAWLGFWHKVATGATGFTGGLFGVSGLAVELPITTGLMFRSIAAIAEDFGEDLRSPETRMECLTLFSYGGPTPEDDTLESAYLTTRLGLAIFVQQSAQFIARASAEEVSQLLARGGAPVLIQLVVRIASRFNVTVAQKALAQAVPMLGAAGGAFVNVAFTDHFNSVARYHFGIRKLERLYGMESVQSIYRGEVARQKERPQLGRL